MRKTTKLAILLAVLAALCLTVFLLSRRQARQEAVRESGETILAIDPESVTSLAWTNESGSFAFRREGDALLVKGMGASAMSPLRRLALPLVPPALTASSMQTPALCWHSRI